MQIWDQQSDETGKHYERFLYYLNLGTDRSYKKVAEKFNLGENTVKLYSTKFNWPERARAYDAYMLKQIAKQNEEDYFNRLSQFSKQYDKVGKKLLKSALHLHKKVDKKLKQINVDELPTKQIIALYKLSINAIQTAAEIQSTALAVDEILAELDSNPPRNQHTD